MACVRFRLVPFRSPLLRESRFLSFPGATEMCHFAPSRCARPMHSGGRVRPSPDRLPYRRSPDIVLASSFPGLFAGCHVLHHLLAPRHPPYTLISLTAVVPPTRSGHQMVQMPLSPLVQFSKIEPPSRASCPPRWPCHGCEGGAWRRPGSNRQPPACKAGALPLSYVPSLHGGPEWTRTTDLVLIRDAL